MTGGLRGVAGVLAKISRLARHGPANLMLLVFKPYWELSGFDQTEQDAARKKVYRQVEAGVLPLSVMGFFAVIYFGLLFFL